VSPEDGHVGQSDYDRRLSEFNRRRPGPKTGYGSRVSSWSDPVSARDIVGDESRPKRKSRLAESVNAGDEHEPTDASITPDNASVDSRGARQRLLAHGTRRCVVLRMCRPHSAANPFACQTSEL
jgi:hypothetical protein